jgi:hypothetical protein
VKTALFPMWHGVEFVRWTARATALAIMVMWLAFVIVEGVPDVIKHPSVALWQLAALLVMFAGFATGWRNERLGGAIALAGWMAFYVVNVVGLGVGPLPAFVLMAVPGVLYLVAWRMARRDLVSGSYGQRI